MRFCPLSAVNTFTHSAFVTLYALTRIALQAVPAAAASVQPTNPTGEGMSAKDLAEFLAPQVIRVFGYASEISFLSPPQVDVPFADLLTVRPDILMQAYVPAGPPSPSGVMFERLFMLLQLRAHHQDAAVPRRG